MKATITEVPFGFLTLEGLMSESGEFFIAIPQLVTLELVPPNRGLKQLESLLGIALPSHQKLQTPLNSKAVNAINLQDFERTLAKLDRKGNVKAQELRDTLAGLSLQQLFSDAFGVKFEAEERQQWLAARMKNKKDFHPVLTASMERNGLIKKPSDWGKYVKWFQDTLGIKTGTRDQLDLDTQLKLQAAQCSVASLLDAGIPWKRALAVVATQQQ